MDTLNTFLVLMVVDGASLNTSVFFHNNNNDDDDVVVFVHVGIKYF